MKKILTILFLALAAVHVANAQAFLDDLRKAEPGQGIITVSQSKEIDDLVNGKGQPAAQHTQVVPPAQHTQGVPPVQHTQVAPSVQHTQVAPSVQHTQVAPSAQNAQSTSEPKKEAATPDSAKKETVHTIPQQPEEDVVPGVVDNRKKVMRNGHKVQGFRIQVFSGGNSRVDRQKAESAGAAMKSNFPGQPVYVHFYSPSWKCRMGNYRTQAEAQTYLSRVKRLGYPQACIVKGTISVGY